MPQKFDDDVRAEMYRELVLMINEQAPWIFMHAGERLVATRSNVHGYTQRQNGQQRLDTVSID
ncbi:MAG: hypothetical protein FWF59_12220 [Turicibacter sp.]|nr:hypothetical protein [Turicibacter sp.]